MANYQISENPTFILAVKALETLNYAHADLFNAIYQVLLNNDNYLDKHKADVNHTHAAATQSANGLMSAADKKKLDGVAASANNYSHPTNAGSKHIPAGGSSGQILRWSADGTAAWGADNNTTYGNMKAATASAAGGAGLVPAPAAGAQGKYLRGDGTWQTPPDTNTTYSAATQSAAGLMSAADKKKLDGVAASANNYSHPASHPASMISQDATHRFATDTEKSSWNSKCRVLNTAWGTTLNIPYGNMGIHGIVILSQHNVYFIWVAGSGSSRKVNVSKLKLERDGDNDWDNTTDTLSFTYNTSTNILTCKTNSKVAPNNGITYIGT